MARRRRRRWPGFREIFERNFEAARRVRADRTTDYGVSENLGDREYTCDLTRDTREPRPR